MLKHREKQLLVSVHAAVHQGLSDDARVLHYVGPTTALNSLLCAGEEPHLALAPLC